MFHTLLKLALEKLATCKIIFQTSEVPKTQIMIFMSNIDLNLATEDKWKALVWAEPWVSPLQDTTEFKMLLEWPES